MGRDRARQALDPQGGRGRERLQEETLVARIGKLVGPCAYPQRSRHLPALATHGREERQVLVHDPLTIPFGQPSKE